MLLVSLVNWQASSRPFPSPLRTRRRQLYAGKVANLFLSGEGIRSAEASQPLRASYSLAEGSCPCCPWTGPLCPRGKPSHLCNQSVRCLPGLLELDRCTWLQPRLLALFVSEKLKNLYFTAGETPAKLCVLFIVWLVEWVSPVVGKTVRGERSSEVFFFSALWWYEAVLLTKSATLSCGATCGSKAFWYF